MKIYLVGYMYSGKSTFGRSLAKARGLRFVDTDRLFENKYHISIPDFFKKYDEPLFRQLEAQLIRSTEEMDDVVVATGGGAPCHHGNMEWMLEHGRVVFLQTDMETLMKRIAATHNPRPLLMGMTPEEQKAFIANQLEQRLPYYTQAHITLDGANPNWEEIGL